MAGVYVDNMAILANRKEVMSEVKKDLKSMFNMKYLGELQDMKLCGTQHFGLYTCFKSTLSRR